MRKFLQNVSKYFGCAMSFEILSQVCLTIYCDENLIIFCSWYLIINLWDQLVRIWTVCKYAGPLSFSKSNQYMATYTGNQQALSYEPFLCILALHTKCKPIQIVYDKWLKWRTFISKSHYSIVCVPKIVINLAFIGEQ